MLHPNIQTHIVKPVYPGRWFILGMNEQGKLTIVYCLMGGSEGSQNRDLVLHRKKLGFFVKTEAVDPDAVTNPELVLYNAVHSVVFPDKTRGIVVTNGRQTDDLIGMGDPNLFFDTLKNWSYEPDNARTNRISAMLHVGADGPVLLTSVIHPESEDSDATIRVGFKDQELVFGEGRFISTYRGEAEKDGSGRIPRFWEPNPVMMPLIGGAADIAHGYMGLLSPKYRVSLIAMTLNSDGTHESSCIINHGKPPKPKE